MTVKAQDILTLVELFESSRWNELHVEIDGLQLFLSTDPNARLSTGLPAQSRSVPAPGAPAATAPAAAPRATGARAASSPDDEPVPAHWVVVRAPNLGTFYRAPKPGAAPFVEIGQVVDEAAELCLLEVMKLFTAVRAGTKGVIRRICVADGQLVEHDQPLYWIEPR